MGLARVFEKASAVFEGGVHGYSNDSLVISGGEQVLTLRLDYVGLKYLISTSHAFEA